MISGPSVVEETLYYIRQTGAVVEVPIHYRERHRKLKITGVCPRILTLRIV